MRLLIVVNVFEPDLGGGVLFSDLAYGLAERGFEVTVRCAYPYYPEWRDKSGKNGLQIDVADKDGVRIERFGIYIPSNPNSLPDRLAYEASFFASLMRRLPSRRTFDGIMVFCPLMGAVAYAAVCRRLTRLPLWLNVQDLPAEAAAAGGIGRPSPLLARTQDALFNQADVWSTISPTMVEQLSDKRRRDQPLLYIPNWLHRSLGDHIARQSPRTDAPGHPAKLLYSGNVGSKQHLLELCKVLHDSSVEFAFRIQAEGSGLPELRAWLHTVYEPRITLHGLSTEEELARRLNEADFVVIPERAGSGGSFIPSKLIPALASGTPVLAVCDASSPLGREMDEHGPGVRFDWDDVGAVADLLASFEPAQHEEWSARAEDRAAFYDRNRVVSEYARELRRFGDVEHERAR